QLTFSLSTAIARNEMKTILQLVPIVRQNGVYKKITSFNVSYGRSNAPLGGNRMPLTNSILASGDWFKFKVEKNGVFQITQSFLESLGMSTNAVNPQNLKVYGHGGKPLPYLNRVDAPIDLPQTPIQVVGGEDGSFDAGDYLLFYGTSTLGYDPENDTNLNPYSDDSYYYITSSGGPGLRIQEFTQPTAPATVTVDQYNGYRFHEEDEDSPAKVGRRWYGNRFDIQSEQSFEFDFPNIVPGSPMNVVIKVGASSSATTSMAMSVNGVSLNPISFSPIFDQTLLVTGQRITEIPAGGETVTVDLSYNNAGNPSSIGYLDYIGIEALQKLTGTGEQFAFKWNDAATQTGIASYQLSNASSYGEIWDVTDPFNIKKITNTETAANFSFKANLGEIRSYVALTDADYYTPTAIAQPMVNNQNLKGTIFNDASGNFQDIEYLIITAPFMMQPALRLARFHKDRSGMNVKVVSTDMIYEEFSSGKQDISAIRNFVRYVYMNASTPDKRIKYLNLFGDTSVDYKNRLPNNNNIVPTFHRLRSTSTFSSFMSDDFYGNMDSLEGTIGGEVPSETGSNINDIDQLDIAVGRIVADNVSLANAMVDKIEAYGSRAAYGNWRNTFVLISDDVDELFEYNALEVNLDNLGDQISDEKPFVNVKKIHSDAYQQESSAGGNRYPEVKEAIANATDVGALVINYFGHGGEDGLAKEFIYTKGVAQDLRNKNRYPLIVTVTCELSKFDLPTRITAGELTYWNPEGGALSLITTTRSISVTTGVLFNQALASDLFGFGLDIPPPPAEAMRRSKNSISSRSNRRVIFYIGDPALELAFPQKKIELTTINGTPIATSTDTLKALSKVKLGGRVTDAAGNLLTNYNGILEGKVFDKNLQRQTLGNDGVRDSPSDVDNDGDPNNLLILYFKTLGETLFNGQATVTNGLFEFEFVVPRDIQVPVGKGRVSLYAQRNDILEDQTGVNLELNVGGLNENAPEDNQGPQIRLFMNDESFISGGITNDSPILIAKLEDENGINTASGIGHDMIAILDGDESNPLILNEYYQAEVDDFTRGTNTYRLRDLEEGLHTLTFKGWDTYNNSSTAEIQFIVAGNDDLKITRVLNYPNPFVDYTEFWFNHNRPFEPLEVQVQVFTITGKVVWTQNQMIETSGFLSRDIVWDGRDDFGDRIGKGVYVYKITVKSTLTNKRVEKFEKLVIL
ncbi:MAG: type IX secretion system sortase PorU, partial [Flavobacteriaceae bacterium]|nr:type IX secretion system sortase PorU [Flavobacteriaceae bacterium]